MTVKKAFIDLDGTVCNSQARFNRAARNGRVDWQIAFQPALLALDEPITGVEDALEKLETDGWTIIFLSSRPESLRRATKDWLKGHGLLHSGAGERQLLLKPQKSRFVSTPKWKAETVCAAGPSAEQVLFIDDESENLSAVKGLWRTKGLDRAQLKTGKSLGASEWEAQATPEPTP